jgi:hypothetical protein
MQKNTFCSIFLLSSVLVLFACGSTQQKEATQVKQMAALSDATPTQAQPETDSMAVLYLSEREFAALPKGSGKKLVFQFYSDRATIGMFSLLAWVGNNGKISGNPGAIAH